MANKHVMYADHKTQTVMLMSEIPQGRKHELDGLPMIVARYMAQANIYTPTKGVKAYLNLQE